MTALPTVLGQGPDIVLLHGVGVGPDSFLELARLLEPDHRVIVPERLGDANAAASLDEQAAAVAALLVDLDAIGARVVGVSGGATLALLLAIRHRHVVGSVVLHEPLVGRLAPALHARFSGAAEQAARSDAAALAVVRGVLGEPTWDRLGPVGQAGVAGLAPRARLEVPVFAAFDPTAGELASLVGLPVLTTVGGTSHPDRQDVVQVLTMVAGADHAMIEGVGNVAHLDDPAAFAALLRRWQPAPIGTGA